jgi:hypothetical protein
MISCHGPVAVDVLTLSTIGLDSAHFKTKTSHVHHKNDTHDGVEN